MVSNSSQKYIDSAHKQQLFGNRQRFQILDSSRLYRLSPYKEVNAKRQPKHLSVVEIGSSYCTWKASILFLSPKVSGLLSSNQHATVFLTFRAPSRLLRFRQLAIPPCPLAS